MMLLILECMAEQDKRNPPNIQHEAISQAVGCKIWRNKCSDNRSVWHLTRVFFKASEWICMWRRRQVPDLDAAIATSRGENVFVFLAVTDRVGLTEESVNCSSESSWHLESMHSLQVDCMKSIR